MGMFYIRVIMQYIFKHPSSRFPSAIGFRESGTIIDFIYTTSMVLNFITHSFMNVCQIAFSHYSFTHPTLVSDNKYMFRLLVPFR